VRLIKQREKRNELLKLVFVNNYNPKRGRGGDDDVHEDEEEAADAGKAASGRHSSRSS
jgi:hypothetical protein